MIDSSLPVGTRAVSAILTRARRHADALPGPPPGLPEDIETAYQIQHLSIADWPDRVAGWKVGGVPPAYIERFEQDRLAGPIFARSVVHAPDGEPVEMPIYRDGFGAIEPEFVFRLGRTRADDRLFIGAEIASSPIPAINDYGPVAVVCDFGNNNGLLVGPEIGNWRDLNDPVSVRTEIDGECIAQTDIDDFPKDPVAALHFLFGLSERLGFDLPEGTYVSSGAITGVHEAPIGAKSRLDFGKFGLLQLELVAAKPLA